MTEDRYSYKEFKNNSKEDKCVGNKNKSKEDKLGFKENIK